MGGSSLFSSIYFLNISLFIIQIPVWNFSVWTVKVFYYYCCRIQAFISSLYICA